MIDISHNFQSCMYMNSLNLPNLLHCIMAYINVFFHTWVLDYFLIFLIAIRQIFHKQMENPSPLCLLPISKGKTNKREIGIGSILKREGD